MEMARKKIAEIIGIKGHKALPYINYKTVGSEYKQGYIQHLIEYESEFDVVRAYLLVPEVCGHHPAILVHHQHNGERHLGKSEVCGLAGNSLQAFGPALVRQGFVVLAPDSICFEDRRQIGKGTEPHDSDFLQHYNQMSYALLKGENLMQKVLKDAINGISVLTGLDYVDKSKIGTMGHSYGGNTVLFLSAMDTRITFACASGSACTFLSRMENNVGIEMASVIPGFVTKYDIDDLVACIVPRKLLIVSAEKDKYSKDASGIVDHVIPLYKKYGELNNMAHLRYAGGHAITQERFDDIINWLTITAYSP